MTSITFGRMNKTIFLSQKKRLTENENKNFMRKRKVQEIRNRKR